MTLSNYSLESESSVPQVVTNSETKVKKMGRFLSQFEPSKARNKFVAHFKVKYTLHVCCKIFTLSIWKGGG